MRWVDLSTVFQSSMNSLNPVVRIEPQFRDTFERTPSCAATTCRARVGELLEMVFIDHVLKRVPARALRRHEAAGHLAWRSRSTRSLSCSTSRPPAWTWWCSTRSWRRPGAAAELGFAVLFISHDLGTVLDLADRIMVMYAGQIVEEQRPPSCCASRCIRTGRACSAPTATRGRDRPHHLRSRPAADLSVPAGCLFEPRCPEAIDPCPTVSPTAAERVGRVACYVARCSVSAAPSARGGGGATRPFAGPQFVKTADESDAREREVLLRWTVSKVYKKRRGLRSPDRGRGRCQLRAAPAR